MKALLIFEMSPEETSLYIIEDPSHEEIDILNDANGKFINIDDDTDAVNEIMDYLCKIDDYCQTTGRSSNCKWSECKVEPDKGKGIQAKIDVIYSCGCLL